MIVARKPDMNLDSGRQLQLDRESRAGRYYRNAVERHWDPFDIDLAADRDALIATDYDEEQMDSLRMGLARFGAGEQAVTEDLAPLAVALNDIDDQMFLTTQLYEEAKHTDFFDRYWREVIHPVEDELGYERSSPTAERWFNEAYYDLFDRNERAVARVLTDDSPEARAKAYCHYHLVIEGILAQTGYYGMQKSYSEDDHPEVPHLPGLVEGFDFIRSDEGRHVGFGMAKLKDLVETGEVSPELLDSTVNELLPLVNGIAADEDYQTDIGVQPAELEAYAAEKHIDRMNQIKDAAREIPDVDSLTRLEGD